MHVSFRFRPVMQMSASMRRCLASRPRAVHRDGFNPPLPSEIESDMAPSSACTDRSARARWPWRFPHMARHAFVDLSAPLWGQVSGTDVHHLEQLRRLPIVGALWYFICARRSNFETVLSRRKRQPRPPFDPIDTGLEVFRQPVVFKIVARNKDAIVGGANCEPQVNPANLSTTNQCEPEEDLIPRLAGCGSSPRLRPLHRSCIASPREARGRANRAF